MGETRRRFHDELDALVGEILAMGELAERSIGRAVEALVTNDAAEDEAVIQGDDEID